MNTKINFNHKNLTLKTRSGHLLLFTLSFMGSLIVPQLNGDETFLTDSPVSIVHHGFSKELRNLSLKYYPDNLMDLSLDVQIPSDDLDQNSSLSSERTEDEPNFIDSLTSNLRFTIDLSTRPEISLKNGESSLSTFLGLDLHKVFSSSFRDIGTATIQMYLTRIDGKKRRPSFFDDAHDWELVYRILNFNYSVLQSGLLNLRIGHFEIPYGLEHVINTNGTQRDYLHGRNIGVKADWGVTLNGVAPWFDYELSISRGSGNAYSSRGNPFLLAARIGTPIENNFSFGLSFLHGEVAKAKPNFQTIRRTRYGIDLQWYWGLFTFLAELSGGKDFDKEVLNILTEINWNNSTESWLIYIQQLTYLQRFNPGWADQQSTIMGARYNLDTHFTLSFQYLYEWTTFSDSEDQILGIQGRYRF